MTKSTSFSQINIVLIALIVNIFVINICTKERKDSYIYENKGLNNRNYQIKTKTKTHETFNIKPKGETQIDIEQLLNFQLVNKQQKIHKCLELVNAKKKLFKYNICNKSSRKQRFSFYKINFNTYTLKSHFHKAYISYINTDNGKENKKLLVFTVKNNAIVIFVTSNEQLSLSFNKDILDREMTSNSLFKKYDNVSSFEESRLFYPILYGYEQEDFIVKGKLVDYKYLNSSSEKNIELTGLKEFIKEIYLYSNENKFNNNYDDEKKSINRKYRMQLYDNYFEGRVPVGDYKIGITFKNCLYRSVGDRDNKSLDYDVNNNTDAGLKINQLVINPSFLLSNNNIFNDTMIIEHVFYIHKIDIIRIKGRLININRLECLKTNYNNDNHNDNNNNNSESFSMKNYNMMLKSIIMYDVISYKEYFMNINEEYFEGEVPVGEYSFKLLSLNNIYYYNYKYSLDRNNEDRVIVVNEKNCFKGTSTNNSNSDSNILEISLLFEDSNIKMIDNNITSKHVTEYTSVKRVKRKVNKEYKDVYNQYNHNQENKYLETCKLEDKYVDNYNYNIMSDRININNFFNYYKVNKEGGGSKNNIILERDTVQQQELEEQEQYDYKVSSVSTNNNTKTNTNHHYLDYSIYKDNFKC